MLIDIPKINISIWLVSSIWLVQYGKNWLVTEDKNGPELDEHAIYWRRNKLIHERFIPSPNSRRKTQPHLPTTFIYFIPKGFPIPKISIFVVNMDKKSQT